MNRLWGYLSAVLVALLFGIWFTLDKTLLGYLHPLALAAMVYTLAGAFLFLIRVSPCMTKFWKFSTGRSKGGNQHLPKRLLTLFLTALFGAVLAPALYLNGLNQITALTLLF
jgi:drug/metabolite transporter (DMT)-like permease